MTGYYKKKNLGDSILFYPVEYDENNILYTVSPPVCFHCGVPYVRDIKYCDDSHTTWMPDCDCIGKSYVRIVTNDVKVV